jgi:hypothetical protein
MGWVTANCPLKETGAGKLALQTAGESKWIANSKVDAAPFKKFIAVRMLHIERNLTIRISAYSDFKSKRLGHS